MEIFGRERIKGLMCYHPGTKEFHYYDEEDGLSNNFVYGLAEDERGNILV